MHVVLERKCSASHSKIESFGKRSSLSRVTVKQQMGKKQPVTVQVELRSFVHSKKLGVRVSFFDMTPKFRVMLESHTATTICGTPPPASLLHLSAPPSNRSHVSSIVLADAGLSVVTNSSVLFII